MSVTGTEQPTKVGVPIADLLAGMNLAYGVVAALHERHRTGRGRVVRTSLLSGVVGVHAFQGTRWLLGGEVPGIAGAHHPAIAPYGMFETATVPVQVARAARRGCGGASRRPSGSTPDEPRFVTNRERVAHRDDLVAVIEGIFATQPAEHWLDLLVEAGIPAGQGARDGRRLRRGSRCARRGCVLDGRPPGVRDAGADRVAAALRRQRLQRGPCAAPAAADCWASTPRRCAPGWPTREPDGPLSTLHTWRRRAEEVARAAPTWRPRSREGGAAVGYAVPRGPARGRRRCGRHGRRGLAQRRLVVEGGRPGARDVVPRLRRRQLGRRDGPGHRGRPPAGPAGRDPGLPSDWNHSDPIPDADFVDATEWHAVYAVSDAEQVRLVHVAADPRPTDVGELRRRRAVRHPVPSGRAGDGSVETRIGYLLGSSTYRFMTVHVAPDGFVIETLDDVQAGSWARRGRPGGSPTPRRLRWWRTRRCGSRRRCTRRPRRRRRRDLLRRGADHLDQVGDGVDDAGRPVGEASRPGAASWTRWSPGSCAGPPRGR